MTLLNRLRNKKYTMDWGKFLELTLKQLPVIAILVLLLFWSHQRNKNLFNRFIESQKAQLEKYRDLLERYENLSEKVTDTLETLVALQNKDGKGES